jgi:ABC-type nickel/cobalt efflux system permease component RcnA
MRRVIAIFVVFCLATTVLSMRTAMAALTGHDHHSASATAENAPHHQQGPAKHNGDHATDCCALACSSATTVAPYMTVLDLPLDKRVFHWRLDSINAAAVPVESPPPKV